MKINYIIAFLVGWVFSMPVYLYWHIEPEPTCEVVETKIWAFQQCLKFQPACQMNKGPEIFAEYKNNERWVAEHCPQNGDGFQSQSSE